MRTEQASAGGGACAPSAWVAGWTPRDAGLAAPLAHPSAGMACSTRLRESQMRGRVLGEERCPFATNFQRSGRRAAGRVSTSLRQVVLPSSLPAAAPTGSRGSVL